MRTCDTTAFMAVKVAKFGGSSVADAAQWRRVSSILQEDADRRVIVVSAPGRRARGDTKVTDLLYECHARSRRKDSFEQVFSAIADRYRTIVRELALSFDLESELERMHAG